MDLRHFTPDEARLFTLLRDGSVGMVQERVPWEYALARLAHAIAKVAV
jgi:hypothetical protein